jgi:organic radical activating enzyme
MNDDIFEQGKKLPIVEEFYTIQGEGYNTGKAAYFIRLGGCDIACSWCDSYLSWNADLFPLVAINEIIKRAASVPAKAVVITGGEPLTYDLTYLCNELKKENIQTFLETSGSYKLTGIWDWICLSPKKQNPPLKENLKLTHELKVVIQKPEDFEWAEINANIVSPECKLFLQPEWSASNKMLPVIVEYVKNNPKWNISLQSHKYMNIP